MLVLNDQTFQCFVNTSEKPVLVKFGAPWCPPCKALAPVLEALNGTRDDVVFAELDIDESPDTAQAYKVFSIPTVIIMWDGAEMGRVVGNQQKSKLVEFIDQCLTS